MSKLIVFTLLLASNFSNYFACGYYPYGEGVRMHFLDINHFNCYSFNEFEYSSESFYPKPIYRENEILPNNQLWFDYCKGKVTVTDIAEAVYVIGSSGFNAQNSNKMIQYLFEENDSNAINYLIFAKSCEKGNRLFSDPWEKKEPLKPEFFQKKINEAVDLSNNTTNESLALRYKFLAIRLAYYGLNGEEVIKIYNSIPATPNKNVLHYWSLYFRTKVEDNKSLRSYYAAQVFANTPDKRFVVFRSFDTKSDINKILKYAKNKEERANIYALSALLRRDRALNTIKKAVANNLNQEFLEFLLLREVNKIEDWVFTPYYTVFRPSIETNFWYSDEEPVSYETIVKRVNGDREYAKSVLNYLNELKNETIEIETIKAQLAFISQDYKACNRSINYLENKLSNTDSLYQEVRKIKALCGTANQIKGKAIIPEFAKQIILDLKEDKRFIFALGRELEYLGNTTDAVLLFSKIDDYEVSWKTRHNKKGSYRDYFSDYFEYVDVIYTPEQLTAVINEINIQKDTGNNTFDSWLTSNLIKEKDKLNDLLGTKYIRQNKLAKAIEKFSEIDSMYWNNNYSLWNEEWHSVGKIFDQNPFYSLKYTPDFIQKKENFYLTKLSVTKKLIEYLELANNPDEENRDLYYLLVANCYKNMTFTGNSWMMRRFGVSNYDVEPYPEDETEFRKDLLSKKYYTLASKYAQNSKFQSLCLWLAKDYKEVEKVAKDEEHYLLMNNNCYAFKEFFEARR